MTKNIEWQGTPAFVLQASQVQCLLQCYSLGNEIVKVVLKNAVELIPGHTFPK